MALMVGQMSYLYDNPALHTESLELLKRQAKFVAESILILSYFS